ncbi:hypothetical protein BD310DRAFT_244014 [Dichomitus squalens]|uniref:Uncharacterized protein n=1 Tax=Dichomitus squalens TaxID=114155 RepID=A0A4Q9PDX6_9APHY|nr:hypothetical protein BD310DRAFT_244014 [Dichomitus squalens]
MPERSDIRLGPAWQQYRSAFSIPGVGLSIVHVSILRAVRRRSSLRALGASRRSKRYAVIGHALFPATLCLYVFFYPCDSALDEFCTVSTEVCVRPGSVRTPIHIHGS